MSETRKYKFQVNASVVVIVASLAAITIMTTCSPGLASSHTGNYQIVVVEDGREVKMTATRITKIDTAIQLEGVVREGQKYDRVWILSGRVYSTEVER